MFFNILLTLTVSNGHIKADLSELTVVLQQPLWSANLLLIILAAKQFTVEAEHRVGTTYVLLLTNHCTVLQQF